jgi:outer membrane lipoprotein-sorting protein
MIPLVISLLVATQNPDPKAVMQRLAKYVNNAHTVTADFVLTSTVTPKTGQAKFALIRSDQLYFSMVWDGIDYKFVGTPHGCWDANNLSKHYDEDDQWRFEYPYSRISPAPGLFTPGFLMDGTMTSDGVRQLRYVGKVTIDGVATDEVEGSSLSGVTEIYIAADGRPVRYEVKHGKGPKIQADIKNLKLDSTVPETLFANNPPLGYVEQSVPMAEYPTRIGAAFPVKGWTAAKPTLVVVTEEGCMPSAKSAPSVANISHAGSVNVAVASLSKSKAVPTGLGKYPFFYDATGTMTRAMNVPGTPMFYLVGKDGKVIKIWSGYDPDAAASFEKDVLDSLKPSASQ